MLPHKLLWGGFGMMIACVALSDFVAYTIQGVGYLYLPLSVPFFVYAFFPNQVTSRLFSAFIVVSTLGLVLVALSDPLEEGIEMHDLLRAVAFCLPGIAAMLYITYVTPQLRGNVPPSLLPHRLVWLCVGLMYLSGALLDLVFLDRPIPGSDSLARSLPPILFAAWPSRIAIILLGVGPAYSFASYILSSTHPLVISMLGEISLGIALFGALLTLAGILAYLWVVWSTHTAVHGNHST